MEHKMTMGGLFAGIGGFELAAQWAGIEPIWSNEIDPYCCAVLRKNFTHEIIEADIKTLSGLRPVDIICGGFPCQPFSTAGKRKGRDDERHLWPEMLRVIREVRPKYVVAENVRGLLNIEGGLVFESCCTDLEAEGYEVQTFIIPACAVNAPHRRDRVWIIAYGGPDGYKQEIGFSGCQTGKNEREAQWQERDETKRERIWANAERVGVKGSTPDTCSISDQGRGETQRPQTTERYFGQCNASSDTIPGWENFPTVSPLRERNDGLPSWLGRSAIKAYGNAIVPQIAYQIFKAIKETETK